VYIFDVCDMTDVSDVPIFDDGDEERLTRRIRFQKDGTT
jgi:hypothetical protein